MLFFFRLKINNMMIVNDCAFLKFAGTQTQLCMTTQIKEGIYTTTSKATQLQDRMDPSMATKINDGI
jgi:hypothetical protein